MRTIKLLLAAVAVLAALCSCAWAADIYVGTSTTSWTNGNNYIVTGTVTIDERITVEGSVTLKLSDGCTLNATQGISVNGGNSLTIEGGSNASTAGKLIANGTAGNAAIGGQYGNSGGTITINGGMVSASASENSGIGGAGIGGGGGVHSHSTITITGGTVTANAIDGAAIGGGGGGAGGNITISGGKVTATATGRGAAIGGGYSGDGGTITIIGGTVTAAATYRGAAIGGGWEGAAGNITISGGTVTATANSGAGIGGAGGAGGNITISGGTVTAMSTYAAGIGGGQGEAGGTLSSASGSSGWIVVSSINADTSGFNGVIFDESDGGNGKVYGNATVKEDVEIPASDDPYARRKLTIPSNATLTVNAVATLYASKGTPRGTIVNLGTEANFVNNGVVRVSESAASSSSGTIPKMSGSGIVDFGDAKEFATGGGRAYKVTISNSDGHGSGRIVSAGDYAAENTNVRLLALPSSGYELDRWQNVTPGITITNDVFTMPGKDVEIRVTFKKRNYAIKVFSVDGGGTASPSKPTANYLDTVTLTPTPNAGYEFDRWAVLSPAIGVSITPGNSFLVPNADVYVAAMFRKITHAITVQGDTRGNTMVSHKKAADGDVVHLSAMPNNGYRFDGWVAVSPAGLTIETDGRFTMPNQAVTVSPTYSALPATQHSITVQDDGHGTGGTVGRLSSAAQGTQITLTHSADPGYEFDRWVGSDGLTISSSKFTMPNSNVVVVALFRKKVYDITVLPGSHGTASPSHPKASSDDVITLTPVPDDGYVLESWETEPAGLVNTDWNRFNMPNRAVTITPIFTALPPGEHAIVVGNDGNGTGTAAPTAAFSGDIVELTPLPNDGYVFDRWAVLRPSGLTISVDSTFEMPNTYVVVNAMFKKVQVSPTDPTITLHNVDGGGRASASQSRAAQGTPITLTPLPNDGYVFDRWVVLKPEGLVISGNTFKMPDTDVDIAAVFKLSSANGGDLDGAINVGKTDGLWSADGGRDLTIYIDIDFDQFTKVVSLDGVPLAMDDETISRDFGAREGSTIVTIWEKTLKQRIKTDGMHKAEIGFIGGTAVVPFAAIHTGSASSGGSGGGGGGCAAGAALAGLAALTMIKRRK